MPYNSGSHTTPATARLYSPPMPATIITARWVIPVEPPGVVWENHAVVIADGRIAGLADAKTARRKYPDARVVERPRHALIPGLINAHTHAPMALMRGFADDLPLQTWLKDHIWPAEAALCGPRMVRAGAELALAEMIRGGVTCFNDMYFFPELVAEIAEQAGMRCCVGLIVLDFPTVWAADADDYLKKGAELHERLRGSDLVTTAFAPHAPYTVSDKPLKRVRLLADEKEVPVHIHVHETAQEVEESMARFGMRPLERLAQLGLLSPRLLAVHMTQLLPQEIESVAAHGAHVLHCPESNLKLADGICPAAALDAAGVNIALGTDSAASNNDMDMLGEMKTAALLAKGGSGDARALSAATVLRMATLNGARALGIDRHCGSLEAGKDADLAAIHLHDPGTVPLYDPVAHIVYSAGREHVSDVWVRGRQLMEQRRLTTLEEDAILRAAGEWGGKFAALRKS